MSSKPLIALGFKQTPKQEDVPLLYKIYVGFEKNADKETVSLEIIDGYLKPNECLYFHSENKITQGTAYYKIEIVKSKKINTYLKIPISMPVADHILVKVFRNGKQVGFQWLDKNGTILGPVPASLNNK